MIIRVVSNPDNKLAVSLANEICKSIVKYGHCVQNNTTHPCVDRNVEFVISVGGDGTLLNTVREMGNNQKPIIGVNRGGVGFLADVDPISEDPIATILSLVSSPILTEKRMRICVVHNNTPLATALNEIVIKTEHPSKIIGIEIVINGIATETYRGDGVIIATPTGSTAYSMSAGGPVVDPLVQGFLITPVSPYMLSARPEVVSTCRKLSVNIHSDWGPTAIVVDGKQVMTINDNSSVEFRVDTPALFVSRNKNFFEKVNTKLRRI